MDKKIFFTYNKDDNGQIALNRVVTVEDNKVIEEDFNVERHGDLIVEFLKQNNIEGETLVSELEEKGLFYEETLDKEKLTKFLGEDLMNSILDIEYEPEEVVKNNNTYFDSEDEYVEGSQETNKEEEVEEQLNEETPINTDFDSEDEYVEDTEKSNSKVGKRVLAGVLAAGAVVGGLALFHGCSQEQIEEQSKDKTLEELLNEMTEEQREFFKSSFNVLETFNARTTEEGNFKLDNDASTLHMSVDEVMALNIILNDYSDSELYEIFGTVEFDATNIMNLSRSAYSKLSTYYMNATKPSGFAEMINDENAREFFEKHESAIIDFNNNPSIDLSDDVIKGLYYDYVVNGATGEYSKINNDGVAWLATSAGFGFELANRNVEEFLRINNVSEEEIAKYQDAAATVGLTLNQITTSELLTGINEEINIDIMDEIDNKSLCASVTSKTKDKIDALTMRQQIAETIIKTNAKDKLVEGLKEAGYITLANELLVSKDIETKTLERISANGAKANELVEEYNRRLSSLNEKEAKVVALLNIAKEKYNSKEEIDLANLVNNRFRSPLIVEKENKVDTTPGVTTEEEKKEQLKEELYIGKDENGTPVYDGDKLNELPKEEKEQFIKDNGVIVDKQENIVKEEKVEKEDLTVEEQQKVVNEEAILKEIENMKNNLITQGVNDAVDYTEEKGAYKYEGDLVIPYNNQKLNADSMSLFNITAYAEAFGNSIDVNDEQIQNRINNDVKDIEDEINSLSSDTQNYLQEKYGSDWKNDFLNESYIYGYNEQIKGILATAKGLAPEIRKTAEEEYNRVQSELDKKNEVEKETTVIEPEKPSVPEVPPVQEETKKDDYDPNLDPNYGMPDEQPYVPKVTMPAYYVSDAELENAFSRVMSEESTSKTK